MLRFFSLGAIALVALGACQGSVLNSTPQRSDGGRAEDSADAATDPEDAGAAWEAVAPSSYVPRIKAALTGLPASQAEIDSVTNDPSRFAELIDTWLLLSETDGRWLEFFTQAFQQGQLTWDVFMDQFGYYGGLGSVSGSALEPVMLQQFRESFPRTALHFVKTNQPFTKTLTTRSFMMTLPLEVMLAYADTQHVSDNADPELANGRNKFAEAFPQFRFEAHLKTTIPLAETLGSAGSRYMQWSTSIENPSSLAACQGAPLVWAQNPGMYDSSSNNALMLQGLLFGRIVHPSKECVLANQGVWAPEPRRTSFTQADFDTWKMVTIRRPAAGEKTTLFYDLNLLRTSNALVLDTPRVGFFTTPAFFANWLTNTSNQARVTMNQTLIVALGKSFDGSKSITPISEESVNGEHATSPVCYGCHQTLDPMRQFFRQAYSLHYHEQDVPAQQSVKGVFAFDGVTAKGDDIYALGDLMAAHPRFAVAWAQKLCVHANSALCDENDPAFKAAVQAFRDSDYNFKTLVRTLYSTPLMTWTERTKTFRVEAPTISIVRQEQMCGQLSNRLGLPDLCGTSTAAPTPKQLAAQKIAGSLPGAAYSRGAEFPSLPKDPSLFYRLGAEQLCQLAAEQVVDTVKPRFNSAEPEKAIDGLMSTVLNIHSNDSRYAALRAVLQTHFLEAKQRTDNPTTALTSTFVLACLSPSHTGSGL